MKNEPPPERAREGNEVGQEKTANDSGRNRKGRSRKMPESEKWSRTHIANRLMVWTTALVAFATLFYAVATAFQVYLFHKNAAETARQTDKLIDASEKQSAVISEALEETRRANREAADRAERALSVTEKQANASQTQANTSQIAARAAESSARTAEQGAQITKEAMRPVGGIESSLGKDTPDEMIVSLKLKNEGGTVTRVIFKYCMMRSTAPNVHAFSDCRTDKTATKGPFTVPAHDFQSIHIRVPPDVAKGAREREFYFYVVGEFSYEDFGVVRVIPYCTVYRDDFKAIGECSDLTEPANQYPIKKNPN